ncbi:MAG TPA: sialate O-acetylesterase [Pyrinomonadaceae bacterium]|nr:sialate O-acetylesterase [Pyrinomonadaceae bacterium]
MTTPRSLFVLITVFLTVLLQQEAFAKITVPSVIGDNMVLQSGQQVRVWGHGDPGEEVSIEIAGKKAKTFTDNTGNWTTKIGPLKPGGPFDLTITGSNTLTIKNVLVGEVWVCSGQSNMEWPLINARNGAEEVAKANHPEIRLFTVQKATSDSPLDDVKGSWVVTTPDKVGQFSAVGYFFGRELQQRLKVPVGLIHTSWGGTPAEAWTQREVLATPELQPIMDRYQDSLKDLPQRQADFQKRLAAWIHQNLYEDEGNKGEAMGYADPQTNTSDWKSMNLPQFMETAGLKIDGAVWFRKEIEIPEAWAGKPLELNLAAIDDYDTTYFNGKRVGGIGADTPNSYSVPRHYQVPGDLVKAGRNVIAVRVFDSAGEGGFGTGRMVLGPEGLTDSQKLALAGPWSYKVESGLEPKTPDWGSRPEAPGPTNQNSPGVLYNAMIAPIVPYSIRGAIWYQGESNAGRAFQYRTLFPTMIRNWRTIWGEGDFPFYFVQLANWQPIKPEPDESEWAELREAQTMTLREPNTGMAVIIDIGDTNDIHPRNKTDVGHRLALWALANTYNQKIEYSGPLFKSFSVNGNEARIKFSHANGLKTSDGAAPKAFAIAGADKKFVWADAKIEGDEIVVSSKAVTKPVAVRYAWADNPVTNLYNKLGLPASPFRTDDWPGITITRK